jgi:hypothetical protein
MCFIIGQLIAAGMLEGLLSRTDECEFPRYRLSVISSGQSKVEVQILRFYRGLLKYSFLTKFRSKTPSLTLANGQGHIVSHLQFSGFGRLSCFQFCSSHQSLLGISSAIDVWKKQKSR